MIKSILSIFLLFLIELYFIESKNLLLSNDIVKEENNLDYIINDESDCPENCLDNKCNNETKVCDECKNGYYGDQCISKCPTKYCIICKQDNGECTNCDNSYILIDKLCCNDYCNKCDDSGCLECKESDKFGKECNKNCPEDCEYNSELLRKCDQASGKCYSCKLGKKGEECKENCNDGCNLEIGNCNKDNGQCKCKDGYYGETCDGKCDENCVECNKENGECLKCKERFYPYGNRCCPENCDGDCPEGKCLKCKGEIYYGDYCENECSKNCKYKTCEKSSGYCPCIEHYTQQSNCTECEAHFDIETNCENCTGNYDIKSNCNSCKLNYDPDNNCDRCIFHFNMSTDCKECENHYSITSYCQECEENYEKSKDCKECKDNFDINSNCKKCITGYYGDKCDKKCYEGCDTSISNCDQKEGECENCLIGYFNKYCNEKCYEGCDTTKKNCNKEDGKCENCLIGYFNDFCNEKCNEGCDISKKNCNKEDGKCEFCLIGYFNDFCSEKCHKYCKNISNICDSRTGKCIECEDGYYGDMCDKKTDIPNCIKVEQDTGNCLKCEDTYYLRKNKCERCSTNCTNQKCEDNTGNCESCKDLDSFGDFCEKKCSRFCNKTENYICKRDTGECLNNCSMGFFSDIQCTQCQSGYYPQDEGCTQECSENCDNRLSCSQIDGSCSCKKGYWGKICDKVCSELCKRGECTPSGECQECVDGYYKENTKCKICPTNCNTCLDAERCTSCKDGKYGSNKCDRNCSSHCEGRTCEINGKCNCDSKFYGETCDLECKGCSANGCEDKTGICVDHFCLDSFYDARMCNKTCSENCLDKKCDIFTGECISCENNKWGKFCNKTCSSDCKDDGRTDCCFIKENRFSKGIKIDISYKATDNNDNLKEEEQNEFSFINIKLGGKELKILIDFETNSPLVIFDDDTQITPIESEIYSINLEKKYKSSESKSCILGDSFNNYYEYDGFFLTKEKSAKDTLTLSDYENSFNNFPFLICQEYKIDRDFDNAGKINGLVGLSLRNYFTENLFYNNETIFPKNILTRTVKEGTKKAISLFFGDYQPEIKASFSKLSTMIIENKQDIIMDKLISFETKFTGIAYSLRKAYHYQYDKKVILNSRGETTIIFNNLYKQFFEKIYFGDLINNGCFLKTFQGGEGEYYCEKSQKSKIQNLPKLGLILGDYIYYLSHEFLYKESEDYYTFLIKMHGQGQQKIELGKSFFNEFSVVYNNGNETLNFFGDVKKLNVPLRDPSNLLNIDSDIFTPGGWVTLIIFITVLIIIFCYLIKYCGEKTDNDEEEDDIDYEEDSLIDETLE